MLQHICHLIRYFLRLFGPLGRQWQHVPVHHETGTHHRDDDRPLSRFAVSKPLAESCDYLLVEQARRYRRRLWMGRRAYQYRHGMTRRRGHHLADRMSSEIVLVALQQGVQPLSVAQRGFEQVGFGSEALLYQRHTDASTGSDIAQANLGITASGEHALGFGQNSSFAGPHLCRWEDCR